MGPADIYIYIYILESSGRASRGLDSSQILAMPGSANTGATCLVLCQRGRQPSLTGMMKGSLAQAAYKGHPTSCRQDAETYRQCRTYFCNLAATSFSCKLGPDRPGRLPGTPESNQNPALRPRPNILRKCRGPQRPQNSPNPVATPNWW